jgi:hypothetical protein
MRSDCARLAGVGRARGRRRPCAQAGRSGRRSRRPRSRRTDSGGGVTVCQSSSGHADAPRPTTPGDALRRAAASPRRSPRRMDAERDTAVSWVGSCSRRSMFVANRWRADGPCRPWVSDVSDGLTEGERLRRYRHGWRSPAPGAPSPILDDLAAPDASDRQRCPAGQVSVLAVNLASSYRATRRGPPRRLNERRGGPGSERSLWSQRAQLSV